ncbi:MAG: SpoIID/LytB domain-containing protein, partial [Actinomycetes bacterium]
MKRFSPRISAAFALTLVLAFTVPAGAASPDSAYGDPVGAIPGQATVADELETPDTFSILSTGSVSVTWGGHGHGIGMPQWGAQAMAFSQGKKHEDILKHFYEGVQFGKTDLEGGTIKQWGNPVRVGLAQGQNWVRFQPKGGPATICFGPRPDSCTNHTAAANETWIVGRTGTACVLKKVVGSGEEEVASFACSNPESGKHGIQFATVTWDPQPGVKIYFPTWASARDLYARGKIEFMTAPSGLVNVRAAMELEEYLYGLGEVPNTWHPEALKAQAVAARSFALYRMWAVRNNADGLRVDCGCHLRNTTADQAYRGYEDSASAGLTEGDPVNGAKWLEAVNSTRGKAMWHTHHGSTRAIEAYYFASTGGATENNPDRWGGTQYPYLKSKNDPGARFETVTYTASTFASKLGFGTGTVERVHIPERYASGRPKKVIVSGKDGSGKALVKEFTSSQFKSALGYGKGDWVKEVTGVQFVDGPIPGALVLHQQSTATWFYIQGGQAETLVYGRPGDIALMGDWDGDGIDTPGLYRQSDGFV